MLSASGPLHEQGPGDITRWMGLPWQADTAFCRAGYDIDYDPFAPTFWPARVPNHILTAEDYAIVTDPAQPMERRIQAFGNRTSWNKPLHGNAAQQMEQMIRIFGSMGLVEVRDGIKDSPEFPTTMMVASYGPDVSPVEARSLVGEVKAQPMLEAAGVAHPKLRPLPRGANFGSREEIREAPLPVRHHKS
jgi:hypothetical protein